MMNSIRTILLLLIVIVFYACDESIEKISSQQDSEEDVTVEFSTINDLDRRLFEISGMTTIDGRVFAHNDSGNDTYLYELDVADGTILRTIEIHNAVKIDWEDITQDDTHLYIGDIGNNLGSRQDLVIYKISKEQLLSSQDVVAESIAIAYADQTEYYYESRTTPYDAEALIAFGDHLYIFTKDWSDYTTHVYPVPKRAGNYTVERLDEGEQKLEVMVTGATYESETGRLALIGYSNPYQPKGLFRSELVLLEAFSQDHFFSGKVNSFLLSHGLIPRQYESVTFYTEDTLLIASEGRTRLLDAEAALYKAKLEM